jgi:hypothetical protein
MEVNVTSNEMPAAWRTAEASVDEVFASQHRAAEAGTEWFAGMLQAAQQQTGGYLRLLAATDTVLAAVSHGFDAQIQASRALKEIVEGGRTATEGTRVLLERNATLFNESVEHLLRVCSVQLELMRAMGPRR